MAPPRWLREFAPIFQKRLISSALTVSSGQHVTLPLYKVLSPLKKNLTGQSDLMASVQVLFRKQKFFLKRSGFTHGQISASILSWSQEDLHECHTFSQIMCLPRASKLSHCQVTHSLRCSLVARAVNCMSPWLRAKPSRNVGLSLLSPNDEWPPPSQGTGLRLPSPASGLLSHVTANGRDHPSPGRSPKG